MFDYNTTFTDNNTIACRNSGIEVEVHGTGHYEQKVATVKELLSYDGLVLRQVGREYEVLWDGHKMNAFTTFEVAENYFRDFTGLTPAKYAKFRAAQMA